jgi:formate--tetrahydrofolate ligase
LPRDCGKPDDLSRWLCGSRAWVRWKGGATGGGRCTVEPAQSINLHFTGDFHAITSAHNLLSASADNAMQHGNLPLTPDRLLWKRVLDMNDRSLRRITTDRGGPAERSTGFDITAASEIMAALAMISVP